MVLAEKGGQDDEENEVELLVAGKKFRILATMNPGGDFGKKEVNVEATEVWHASSGHIDWLVIGCATQKCIMPILASSTS